ncbi:MAG: PhnE/PtxC family ABC transporter permease [Acidimicrobiales bacterium]
MSIPRSPSSIRLAIAIAAAVAWAVSQAGVGGGVVNLRGWSSFARFWQAIFSPELAWDFLQLTGESAAITLAYAVLGTALSLLIGSLAAPLLSELLWSAGPIRSITRAFLVVPRAVHEILWALLLIQVLGFDPLVSVLAIGIPFGAVTAKVFAETIDEADSGPYRQLRATGAGRLSALVYGVLPSIRGQLISYSFYRLECGVRSAAVLGVIGAGGLGFQLDLSFESLRYGEIWTLIVALMLLSGAIEAWSSHVRTRLRSRLGVGRGTLLGLALLVPLSWRWVGLDPTQLVSDRTRRLAGDLLGDLFPTRLGPGGWSELFDASVDTVAMSILALLIAVLSGLVLAGFAARPSRPTATPGLGQRLLRVVAGTLLLLFRAVPSPIWAFLMVLVLFPGTWPGAVALGIYTLGVLGRLFAEVFEDRDLSSAKAADLVGANAVQAFFYAVLPGSANRLISLSLYRWEVIARETVVVGVVGAGGLGQLINEHLAARDFAAVTGAIGALLIISFLIDSISGVLRRGLRDHSAPAVTRQA